MYRGRTHVLKNTYLLHLQDLHHEYRSIQEPHLILMDFYLLTVLVRRYNGHQQ